MIVPTLVSIRTTGFSRSTFFAAGLVAVAATAIPDWSELVAPHALGCPPVVVRLPADQLYAALVERAGGHPVMLEICAKVIERHPGLTVREASPLNQFH